eukprot:TRINITY_DN8206_c1_g2_i2.p1 TRINITY_DN8206_c1_g2~~TRINITY_DN8206_c1_g2_i2.p1  ORF type:complete len:160 (-),score=20.04 TRINITY_DN8206_c1_g2_i2:41-520(-)
MTKGKQGFIKITKVETDNESASFDVCCETSACPKAEEISPPCGFDKNATLCPELEGHKLKRLCIIHFKDAEVGGVIRVTAPKDVYVFSGNVYDGAGHNTGSLVAFLAGTTGIVCGGFCGVFFLIAGLCCMVCGRDDSACVQGVRFGIWAPAYVQYNPLH